MTKDSKSAEPEDHLESKTKRKAHMTHLQQLGERLIDLRPDQVSSFELDGSLADAIAEAQRIRSREALRRQKQYIGKLMRKIDVEPIEQRFAELDDHTANYTSAFQELEVFRDTLVSGDKQAIGQVIERFPSVDRQKLRQLTKRAQREVRENSGKTARRTLFKFLRETQSQQVAQNDMANLPEADAPEEVDTDWENS